MRPKDEYIAAAFWERSEAIDPLDSTPDDDLMFVWKVRGRAEELQKAAENPARTTCKTCGGMMVDPRPCRADNCGVRK